MIKNYHPVSQMLPVLEKFFWVFVQDLLEMSDLESNNRGVTSAMSVHLTHLLELSFWTVWLQVLQVSHVAVGALERHCAGVAVGSILFNAGSSSDVENFANVFDSLFGFSEVLCGRVMTKGFFEILTFENGTKASMT